MSNFEQTLSIIKPDAVERKLINEIRNIFLKNKLNIKDSKKIQISKDEAAEFYKVHQSKPFYNDLCAYLFSKINSCNDFRRKKCCNAANRKINGSYKSQRRRQKIQ